MNIVERRFQLDNVSITLSTMDKLIQMGKELGYEGHALQEFVKPQQAFKKQQQDIERSERLAEGELEKERIAAEKEGSQQRKKGSQQRKIRLRRLRKIGKLS